MKWGVPRIIPLWLIELSTFVWRASVFRDSVRRHLPGHEEVLASITGDLDRESYERFENVPVDIGILERADNVEVVPASFVEKRPAKNRVGIREFLWRIAKRFSQSPDNRPTSEAKAVV